MLLLIKMMASTERRPAFGDQEMSTHDVRAMALLALANMVCFEATGSRLKPDLAPVFETSRARLLRLAPRVAAHDLYQAQLHVVESLKDPAEADLFVRAHLDTAALARGQDLSEASKQKFLSLKSKVPQDRREEIFVPANILRELLQLPQLS